MGKLAKRAKRAHRMVKGGVSVARRAGAHVVRRARRAAQKPQMSHVAEAALSAAVGAGLAAVSSKYPDAAGKLAVGPLNPALTIGLAAAVVGTMVKPVANGKAGAAVRAAANAALAVGAHTMAADKMSSVGEDDTDVGFEDDADAE